MRGEFGGKVNVARAQILLTDALDYAHGMAELRPGLARYL
jgi:hypothetical protein